MKIKKLMLVMAAAALTAGCGKESAKESSGSVKTSDKPAYASSSASEETLPSESSAVIESSSAAEPEEGSAESSSAAEPEEGSAESIEESIESAEKESDLLPAGDGFESSEAFFDNWKALMKKYYAYEKLVFFYEGDREKMSEISAKAADEVFALMNGDEIKALYNRIELNNGKPASIEAFVKEKKAEIADNITDSLMFATEYLMVDDEGMSVAAINEVFNSWDFPEKSIMEWNLDEFYEEYKEKEKDIMPIFKELGLEGVISTDGLELMPEEPGDMTTGFDFMDDDIAIMKYNGRWYLFCG